MKQLITETKKELQYIMEHRLVNIIIHSFAVFMFCCAFVLRDWLGMFLTCFPLNLLIIYKIVYLLAKKKLSNNYQNLVTLLISFLYMLYIWTPLTDGTVGDAIRKMRHSGMTGAVTNGIIGGIGMTDTNNPMEYATNIGLNTAGSVAGEKFGNILENKTNNLLKERAKNLSFGLSKSARAFTKMGANSATNQISSWRKDDEW